MQGLRKGCKDTFLIGGTQGCGNSRGALEGDFFTRMAPIDDGDPAIGLQKEVGLGRL